MHFAPGSYSATIPTGVGAGVTDGHGNHARVDSEDELTVTLDRFDGTVSVVSGYNGRSVSLYPGQTAALVAALTEALEWQRRQEPV